MYRVYVFLNVNQHKAMSTTSYLHMLIVNITKT